ncbi:hypothetical protein AC249_AIPGENE19434 [Exaiptasia diaphana]|nr:hypothetical protein AC249_AIPGENE19434 [Exaiptasia diaphana]
MQRLSRKRPRKTSPQRKYMQLEHDTKSSVDFLEVWVESLRCLTEGLEVQRQDRKKPALLGIIRWKAYYCRNL